jgi:hypothetical protein
MIFQTQDVQRTFGYDFILLDLTLMTCWITILLALRRKTRPVYFGLFGYGVYFFADYVLWFTILHTRHIAGIDPFVFELYFSLTYAMLEFSYIILMFEEPNKWRVVWTVFLFTGWLVIGLLSTNLPSGGTIIIDRDMTSQRPIQLAGAIGEYFLLAILAKKKIAGLTFKKVILLFVLGVYVAISMEVTLMIPGIRPASWSVFYFDSLFEINTGVPILYLLWWMFSTGWLKKQMAGFWRSHQVESSSSALS